MVPSSIGSSSIIQRHSGAVVKPLFLVESQIVAIATPWSIPSQGKSARVSAMHVQTNRVLRSWFFVMQAIQQVARRVAVSQFDPKPQKQIEIRARQDGSTAGSFHSMNLNVLSRCMLKFKDKKGGVRLTYSPFL